MSSVPKNLEPKLFRIEREPVLLGSQCTKCHRVFFPAQGWCGGCSTPSCKPIELGRRGTLKSYTVVFRKTSYSVVTPPYIVAEIELPEGGVLVYSTLNLTSAASAEGYKFHTSVSDEALSKIKLGQAVILSPVAIRKDEEGHEIVAYNFSTAVK